MTAFDISSILGRVHSFAAQVPQILRRVGSTAPLADEVARLLEVIEVPFTMAVLGPMRGGKSTLINALVGEDLAVTGVTETTATVNWLKYGTPEQARTFRVVWRGELGREPEVRDRAELEKWVGDSELATQTRFLELFSTTEFLRHIQVVDTPGTRSVLSAHEDTVRGFLAEKHEHETLLYGGAADCIVYVLNPIARAGDVELLHAFESRTRLPDSSPYNSVAVIHKWESLENDDPHAEADRMAAVAATQLRRYVADVIPVSGPLGQAARRQPTEYWDDLASFLVHTPGSALQRMLTGLERQFAERALLEKARLPWPCFKAVLKLGASRGCKNGAALQALVEEASGLERLLKLLHRRFFDRARVIRAFNLLGRAMSPCEKAISRLRENEGQLLERRGLAQIALTELAPFRQRLANVGSFLAETATDLDHQHANLEGIRRELEDQLRLVREDFERFSRELEAIRAVDDNPEIFPDGECLELLSVLGAYGSSLEERIYCYRETTGDTAKVVQGRLSHWVAQTVEATGTRRQVLRHVVARLEDVLIALTKPHLGKGL